VSNKDEDRGLLLFRDLTASSAACSTGLNDRLLPSGVVGAVDSSKAVASSASMTGANNGLMAAMVTAAR